VSGDVELRVAAERGGQAVLDPGSEARPGVRELAEQQQRLVVKSIFYAFNRVVSCLYEAITRSYYDGPQLP